MISDDDLPGHDHERICDAITRAYNRRQLTKLLRHRMDFRLDDEVAESVGFSDAVFELVEWALREGRVRELVRAAVAGKPQNPGLQRLNRDYGLAVAIEVSSRGTPLTKDLVYLGDEGLQELVRGHTLFADEIWVKQMFARGQQVCRVLIGGGAAGTGFLVGPDLVLTAGHVIASVRDQAAPDLRFHFDYRQRMDGTRADGTVVGPRRGEWLLADSKPTAGEVAKNPDLSIPGPDELDYALIRLEVDLGNRPADPGAVEDAPKRRWVRLPPKRPEFTDPMGLTILQHPDGLALRMAIDTSGISQADGFWLNSPETRVRYATRTGEGSSGAPCFNLSWDLVALHIYGGKQAETGKKFNLGVPIAAVRASLQARLPDDVFAELNQ
jgi:hypothetical protein